MEEKLNGLREWLQGWSEGLRLDCLPVQPGGGSLTEAGGGQVWRREDILGNARVRRRWDLGVYLRMAKSPGDDAGALANAAKLLELENWVAANSGDAPLFGERQRIWAHDGKIYSAEEEGTAVYKAVLSVEFETEE